MAGVDQDEERAGAEVVTGREECLRASMELLEEIGFPKGMLPLKELVECGMVRETGYVWMKQSAPSEHYFEGAKALVSYAAEVTGYVEKHKMKKMTGVKTKPFLFWIPLVEMSIVEFDLDNNIIDDASNSNTTTKTNTAVTTDPISISISDPISIPNPNQKKDKVKKKKRIYFKTSLGVGRYHSIKAFMTDEEKHKYTLELEADQTPAAPSS